MVSPIDAEPDGRPNSKEIDMATPNAIVTKIKPITLPPLPWADNALEPVISKNTISFHYGKHHQTYVDKLNELIGGTPEANMPLEDIVRSTVGDPKKVEILHNAQQTWNHTFYWNSLRPKGGGKPPREIEERIESSFGGYDAFKKAFAAAAVGQFGSGWAWLIAEEGKLKVVATPDGEDLLPTSATPLLTLDVWEHAYYLDYQNRRKDYVVAAIDNLLNWEFAAQNLSRRSD
jgi:superoxide dismutase, Fe-Mn family